MKQRLGLLVAGTILVWILAAYPARWFYGSQVAIQSLVALLVCLVPAAATLCLSWKALAKSPEWQLLAVLGGGGLRMFTVLGAGVLLYSLVPGLGGLGFWIWLIVFYLTTLGLEMGLLLVGRPALKSEH